MMHNALNQPQIIPANSGTNVLAKIKNLAESKENPPKSFISNVQLNPVLNRASAGRFIDRKTITCVS
jgi:hypothetical protein